MSSNNDKTAKGGILDRKIDRRSFFAGSAALGASVALGGAAKGAAPDDSPSAPSADFAVRAYDHVVVGGGFAGVAAALASARNGAKTCLLERTCVLGGLSTQGHVVVFMPLCDGYGRQVTFGIPEELLRLPMRHSAAKPRGAWKDKKGTKAELSAGRYELMFDPGPMMLGLEESLIEAGVDIVYDCEAVGVRRDGLGRILSLETSARCGKTRLAFAANAYTDATGAATVAQLCGEGTVGGLAGNVPTGWYYVVDGNRSLSIRCGARNTLRSLFPGEVRDYAGDDADERTRHTIATHRAILLDNAEENKRRAAKGDGPVHVFSIPTYPTLLKLSRIARGAASDAIVGVFSDWRRRGPVYPLRYGQLVTGVGNLIVAGRCIACEEAMWDVVRCLPACCVSGQAAGTAAAMLAKGGSFASLDAAALRRRLVSDGVRLDESLLVPDPAFDGVGEAREEGVF